MSRFANLWRKAILTLVIAIAILQVIHMILVSRLEAKRSERNRNALGRGARGVGGGAPPPPGTRSGDAFYGTAGDGLGPWTSAIYSEEDSARDREELMRSMEESSVLDASGQYHIINFLSRGLSSSDGRNFVRRDLCLVTHASLGQLYHLIDLIDRWTGPISITLFAADQGQVAQAIEAILLTRKCLPQARWNTTFHLVYPFRKDKFMKHDLNTQSPHHTQRVSPTSSSSSTLLSLNVENCDHLRGTLKSLGTGTRNYVQPHGIDYPNNLLRNVGRRNSLCEFVLVMDVDLTPSVGLYESFVQFARDRSLFSRTAVDEMHNLNPDNNINNNNINNGNNHLNPGNFQVDTSKTVYVIPSFEIKDDQQQQQNQQPGPSSGTGTSNGIGSSDGPKIPRDKRDLLAAYASSLVRPFYMELCWKCQMHTDYETWLSQPISHQLDVLYEVLWREPWEPFYIGPNSVPVYDERFRQYGFNRISQLCELHMAGYKFAVLNNPFLVHKGLKKSNSFHVNKDLEQEKNRVHYRQFKANLKEKYPDSTRRCY